MKLAQNNKEFRLLFFLAKWNFFFRYILVKNQKSIVKSRSIVYFLKIRLKIETISKRCWRKYPSKLTKKRFFYVNDVLKCVIANSVPQSLWIHQVSRRMTCAMISNIKGKNQMNEKQQQKISARKMFRFLLSWLTPAFGTLSTSVPPSTYLNVQTYTQQQRDGMSQFKLPVFFFKL